MFPENSNFASPTKLLILGILLLRILRGINPFHSEVDFNFLRLRSPLLCLSVRHTSGQRIKNRFSSVPRTSYVISPQCNQAILQKKANSPVETKENGSVHQTINRNILKRMELELEK